MLIYIGNIPLNATDADLCDLVASHGRIVTAAVSIDQETDRSLGFGLVELDDAAAASNTVQRLDGSKWNGRTLVVKVWAEPARSGR